MSYSIYHDLNINASSKKIYDAISNPSKLEKWWPLRCTGTPKEGEVYNFYFGDPYDWLGKVTKAEENKSFFIKMTKSDEDWNPTTFGFEIEQQAHGQLVSFSHTGWPSRNQHFKRSSFCWAILLNGLKNYVEKGLTIPFENRN